MPALTTIGGVEIPIRGSRNSTTSLAVLNADAELVIDGDASVTIGVNAVSASTATINFFGVLDGNNIVPIPAYTVPNASVGGTINLPNLPLLSEALAGFTRRLYSVKSGQFKKIIVRATTAPTVAITVIIAADTGDPLNPFCKGEINAVTSTPVTGAVSAVAVNSIAPGTGLRVYVKRIRVERYATAVLTAAVAPQIVTTTLVANGTLRLPTQADAAGVLTVSELLFDGAGAFTALGSTLTVTVPLVTGAIQTVIVDWYLGQ